MSALAACIVAVVSVAGSRDGLVREELRIPVMLPARFELEALIVRPDDGAKHPLALVSHGSPRDQADARRMTPYQMLPQAEELARRGWTAAIVMRRGFGSSDGEVSEYAGPKCETAEFVAPGQESANEMRQAIAFLVQRPFVDGGHILAVGHSAGGFGSLALSADPPPGLVAAVSFAGGKGSTRPDFVCNVDALVRAFASFGAKSRIPTLWVYAENDHFFSPELARRFHQAFVGAGGRAELIQQPPFGDDGHALFSLEGIPRWAPPLDAFLKTHGLQLRGQPIPRPPLPDIPPPPDLGERSRAGFQTYLAGPGHKAFAAGAHGHVGWRFARRSVEEAVRDAIRNCEEGGGAPCHAYMIDAALAAGPNATPR